MRKPLFLRSLFFFSLLLCAQLTHALPIVLVHGILSDDYGMQPTEDYIHQYLPGTYVKNIEIGLGVSTSVWNMHHQVEWLRREIEADPMLADGFIFIAHSQGGLVSRAYVEKYNNPRAITYISLGSPQQGVFGTPTKLDDRFFWLNVMERYTYRVLYSTLCQKFISFAGYWQDPLHYNSYLDSCCFLPYINNHKNHLCAELYRKNIMSLENMVLVASPNDHIIEPQASCHFGFYRVNSHIEIEELFDMKWFEEDKLGLKTLHDSGRLHLRTAYCSHVDYQEDEENFVNNVLPFLT